MRNLISYFLIIFGFFIHSNQYAASETKKNGFITDVHWLNKEKGEKIVREIFIKNDCPIHGLFRYIRPGTEISYMDIFGVFAYCDVNDPDSNLARIFYDKEGKIWLKTLDKKDVTNVYGERKVVGLEIQKDEGNLGVKIVNLIADMPASETQLKKNDVIIKVNSSEVKNVTNFIKLIDETEQNQKIKIEYIPSDKIKNNFNYELSDIKTVNILPKLVNHRVKLLINHDLENNYYYETIRNYSYKKTTALFDWVALEKDTPDWIKQQKLLKKDFDIIDKYYMTIRDLKSENIPVLDFRQFNIIENKQP